MRSALAALLALAAAQQAAAQDPQAPSCDGEEYAAFDFWVGEWDVYQAGGDRKVADSRIEKVSNGCAVRETWMPLQGGGGASLTTLDPRTGTWNQLWVGGQPGRIFFEGGPVGEDMVLTGYWGRDPEGNPNLVRMTYTLLDDGAVRQHGQASSDHGVSWSDSFDLVYRRKSE